FFLADVFIRPPVEGVDRESQWRAIWGKILMLALVYLPLSGMQGSATKSWLEAVGVSFTAFWTNLGLLGRVWFGGMGTPRFAVTSEPSLYTKGLYRFIRHPIYTGFALVFFGHQITFMFMPGLIIWLALLASFIHTRIRVEEEMLVEQFRDGYLEYQKRTWKLFPYV